MLDLREKTIKGNLAVQNLLCLFTARQDYQSGSGLLIVRVECRQERQPETKIETAVPSTVMKALTMCVALTGETEDRGREKEKNANVYRQQPLDRYSVFGRQQQTETKIKTAVLKTVMLFGFSVTDCKKRKQRHEQPTET